jgi:hypothetical protein
VVDYRASVYGGKRRRSRFISSGFDSGTARIQAGGTDRITVGDSLVTINATATEFTGGVSSAFVTQTFSATPTFDFSLGNNHSMAAATANITAVTLSNPRSGAVYIIKLLQDGGGGWTIAWPAETRFEGTEATFGATANNVTLWAFVYEGAVYRCLYRKVYAS